MHKIKFNLTQGVAMVDRVHGQGPLSGPSWRNNPSREMMETAELADEAVQETFENILVPATRSLRGRVSQSHKRADKPAREYDRRIRLNKAFLAQADRL
jgi:hypothetical protein